MTWHWWHKNGSVCPKKLSSCPEKLWMPHAQRQSRSGWMGPEEAWSSEWQPCSQWWVGTGWASRSFPIQVMILWIAFPFHWTRWIQPARHPPRGMCCFAGSFTLYLAQIIRAIFQTKEYSRNIMSWCNRTLHLQLSLADPWAAGYTVSG